MDDNKMAKGLLLGFLTGTIVGGVVALLYAPKTGKELRSDIKIKKDEFLDDTSEYMQIAKEKANKLINEGKKKSEMLIKDAKDKVIGILGISVDITKNIKTRASLQTIPLLYILLNWCLLIGY